MVLSGLSRSKWMVLSLWFWVYGFEFMVLSLVLSMVLSLVESG